MLISDWSSDVCSSDLQRAGGSGGALGQRVEEAQALQLVAEEVEPQGLFLARRKHVDDAAAHRELARLADGLDPVVAVLGEKAVEAPGRHAFAGLQPDRKSTRLNSRH